MYSIFLKLPPPLYYTKQIHYGIMGDILKMSFFIPKLLQDLPVKPSLILRDFWIYFVFSEYSRKQYTQGWEFSHRFSERIAQKNEQFTHSLIFGEWPERFAHDRSFPLRTWANRSWLLIFGERPEQVAHIAHFWWATWVIHSHRSPNKRKWVICSFFK